MPPKTDPFSIRLDADVYDRLWSIIEGTGGEITRSEIIDRAVRLFLHVLESEPAMIPGYDPDRQKSVAQKARK